MSLKIKVCKKIKAQCDNTKDVFVSTTLEILDDTKQPIKCETSGIGNKLNLNCFWDRHPIKGRVIQCPIRFKPKQIVKTYKHNVSNEDYTIKENVVSSSELKSSVFQIIPANLEVADAFCSFSCCLSWIQSLKGFDPTYDQSEMILMKLWREENKKNHFDVLKPAPSWRTLIEYGGTMTIDTFRNECSRTEFIYQGTILDTKYLFSKNVLMC
ncbi:hypothetical protein IIV31_014R [Armadillidium vulgare iridescent virus]|uniref:Uncharacterized protein n=1 Tax=Armadillidium vulgare iridescent virus TaxID=72201 RepID=A0A068QKA3_9VIRU|nr:hypothetical protein IIV31_014R [Armadillidium vulgare iridescent virus]CCV02386.1 hypothetical protein IIV31_014R [Armadillidium vulgare iridescent virus]